MKSSTPAAVGAERLAALDRVEQRQEDDRGDAVADRREAERVDVRGSPTAAIGNIAPQASAAVREGRTSANGSIVVEHYPSRLARSTMVIEHESDEPGTEEHDAGGRDGRAERSDARRDRARARSEGESTCGTFDLGISKATRSHHFKVLREAGPDAHARRGHAPARVAAPRGRRRALPGAARRRRWPPPSAKPRLPRSPPDRLVGHLRQQLPVGLLADHLGLDRVGHAALLPGDRRR